jgi:hypothetical protein
VIPFWLGVGLWLAGFWCAAVLGVRVRIGESRRRHRIRAVHFVDPDGMTRWKAPSK